MDYKVWFFKFRKEDEAFCAMVSDGGKNIVDVARHLTDVLNGFNGSESKVERYAGYHFWVDGSHGMDFEEVKESNKEHYEWEDKVGCKGCQFVNECKAGNIVCPKGKQFSLDKDGE